MALFEIDLKPLTPRQAEFLALSARGWTHQEIAGHCFVSVDTVKSTFSKARLRMGVKTTLQCFCLAVSREELGIDHNGMCFVPVDGDI